MNMDTNAHSVFLLNYHLILVTKYRRRVFDDVISDRAKEIFLYICSRYHITLLEWNHDVDHIHILFKAHPSIREKLWKEKFWSQSFCLMTTGSAPLEVIKQYIKSQGEKV